ncbi:sensor histidine kinase [Desulfonatronum parangueonense]
MNEDIESLRKRLKRAEDVLEAIRNEEVDAVVGTRKIVLLKLQETEKELRDTERRLRLVMESAKVASWELDLATGSLTSCLKLRRMFGLPEQDCPHSRDEYLRLYSEEDRQKIKAADERAIRTGEQYEMEFRIRRPSGVSRWLRSLVVPVADDQGQVVKLIGLITDITREVRSREVLQESEKRFRVMADGSPFPIWVNDVHGRSVYVNQAYSDFFGVTIDDLKKNEWHAFVHPEDEETYTRSYLDAVRERRFYSASGRLRRHDGEWRWIKSQAAPRFSKTGRFLGMVGSSTDITDHIRAEEEIARKNEELEQALEERDRFFSIIAHDLRSPFMGFLVFIKMLTERIDKLSLNEVQRLSEDMHESARNLHRLLENLLEWSLTQRGEIAYTPVRCDLAEMVHHNIELIKMVALQKGVEFQYDISENVSVLADKHMLNTILRNLLTNAVKFSNSSGQVRVRALLDESVVQISVKDDGIGIDRQTLTNLLKLDKMRSRKGTSGEKGTGLGLLLCKEFIEKHEGKIWVDSKVNKGTTIYFTLPLYAQDLVTSDPDQRHEHQDFAAVELEFTPTEQAAPDRHDHDAVPKPHFTTRCAMTSSRDHDSGQG